MELEYEDGMLLLTHVELHKERQNDKDEILLMTQIELRDIDKIMKMKCC